MGGVTRVSFVVVNIRFHYNDRVVFSCNLGSGNKYHKVIFLSYHCSINYLLLHLSDEQNRVTSFVDLIIG